MFCFCKSTFLEEIAAQHLDHTMAVSNHDLKLPRTLFSEHLHATLDSQVTFFLDFCPQSDSVTKLTTQKDSTTFETNSTFHERCPKYQKLGLGLNLKEYTSSFAPASQQRIKRLKPTNTRFKQQFD